MGIACSEISCGPDLAQMEVEYEALIGLCSADLSRQSELQMSSPAFQERENPSSSIGVTEKLPEKLHVLATSI